MANKIFQQTIKFDGFATEVDDARGLVIGPPKPAVKVVVSATKLPMIIIGAVNLVIGPLTLVANVTFLAIKLLAPIAGETSLTI